MNKQQLANRIWASANKMRAKIDANEYKDYILGLIFYKFLSDNEVNYLHSIGWTDEDLPDLIEDYENSNRKLMIDYCKNNIGYFIEYKNLFSTWLLPNSNFSVADLSMALNNFDRLISPSYKPVYDGIFKTLQSGLSKLGENPTSQTRALKDIIKLIRDIPTDGSQDYDVLGYVYEFLIGNFAANAGKKAGEFYTPHEVAMVMSEIVAEHHKDKKQIEIYDPTSGSGSLLITIGKSVGRHIEDMHRVKYYAQELKENTYNLTRMNLVMRGIRPGNINTRCADSLDEDWPVQDNTNGMTRPLYVDAVVSNPPYSQHWDPTDAEMDARFKDYGVAPKSKADYAFLLHELHHLKPDGILTIVLPHGVLFRGTPDDDSEGQIRRKLIEKNQIDCIIGLPANIFYGTGIPTLIMVLKQHRQNDDVLIIDASKGFVKDGTQNRLRACDIKRIADVVRDRSDIPGFSRKVSRDLIRENDYNLNIPRYVDSSESPEQFDIYATMFGGIPNNEIDLLDKYWQAFPTLRGELFAPIPDSPCSALKVKDTAQAIDDNDDVKAFKKHFAQAFCDFGQSLHLRLIDNVATVKEMAENDYIAGNIFRRMEGLPLVDGYAAYQILSDHWQGIMGDIEIIQTEGLEACKVVETNYKVVKKDGLDEEVPDGEKGRIMPFELVQTHLLADELTKFNDLQAKRTRQENVIAEILEQLEPEAQDLLLNEDNTRFDKTALNKAWEQVLADISSPEIAMLDEYLTLSRKPEKLQYIASHPSPCWSEMATSKDGTYSKKEVKSEKSRLAMNFKFEEGSQEEQIKRVIVANETLAQVSKEIKVAAQALENHTKETIRNLDAQQIDKLLELKWIQPITDSINKLPANVLQGLCDPIQALCSKYSNTFSDIERSINDSGDVLAGLIDQLTGDEVTVRCLQGFKNVLK